MKHGRVYWITGLSGSGKTTIGVALYYRLREKSNNVIILDGDILKVFVGDKVGYSQEERLLRAKKYSQICKVLADQGMYVIICTIAMYDEVRRWNRKNINGYIEIFLDVPVDILIKRDKKGLYSTNRGHEKNVVGFSSEAEFPQDPDIKLVTDGSVTVDECINKIERLVPRVIGDFDRDSKYWDKYYENQRKTKPEPSDFARYLISTIKKNDVNNGKTELLEIGCGNGRDSLYFLETGMNVTGIDASKTAIAQVKEISSKYENAIFICDDFVKCKAIYQRKYDYIYSRFTLHAINAIQEDELLTNIVGAMKPGSKLFIEARTINDDLYGKGEKLSENEYIFDGHYRRFVKKEDISNKLYNFGLDVMYLEETRGFSKTSDSDPVLMRLIAVCPVNWEETKDVFS